MRKKLPKVESDKIALLFDNGDILDLIDAIGYSMLWYSEHGKKIRKGKGNERLIDYWANGRIYHLDRIMEMLYNAIGVKFDKKMTGIKRD